MTAESVGACGFAVALILIVGVAPRHPRHAPEVAGLGTIVRGSMVRSGLMQYRMTLEHPLALDRGWPPGDTIDVDVVGELPDTVCDGTRVYVSGTRTARGIAATVVQADVSKYDRCFQWRCHPAAYESCRGTKSFR